MNNHAVNLELANKDIDKIIENTSLPRELYDLKNSFKTIFKALKEHEVSVIDEIKKQIMLEKIGGDSINHRIYTIIVPDYQLNKWLEKGFYPMIDDNDGIDKLSFFDGSYDELVDCINKNQLIFDDTLILKEKDVFDIYNLYNIEYPVIFSPWSRRLVKCINGYVSDKIIEHYIPMWNVKYNEAEKIGEPSISVAPDNDEILYTYMFAGVSNSYLSFDNVNMDMLDIDIINGDIQVVSHQQIDYDSVKILSIVDVSQVQEYANELEYPYFINNFVQCQHSKRLLTKGDIEKILNCFIYENNKLKFKCSFLKLSFEDKPEEGYIKGYTEGKYSYNSQKMLYYSNRRLMKLPWCYINFEGTEKWLEDYSEYVLSYLKNFYPDYRWVGVHQ